MRLLPIHMDNMIGLASTVSKMSAEIMVKCKNELFLKMGTPPSLN